MVVLNRSKFIGNHLFKRVLMISFFWFTEICFLQAQRPYSKFDYLTIDEGLSSNRIRCISRDSKDYLWIGTDVDLDKYDSYQVKKYRMGRK